MLFLINYLTYTNKYNKYFRYVKIFLDIFFIIINIIVRYFKSMNPQFNPSELSYTKSLGFWVRAMHTLRIAKVINKEYTLKQIRSTFISYLINVLKMDVFTVQKLADHSDAKITDKHYIKLNLKGVREHLDEMTLESFISEDEDRDFDRIKLALMMKKGASNKKDVKKAIAKKLRKLK